MAALVQDDSLLRFAQPKNYLSSKTSHFLSGISATIYLHELFMDDRASSLPGYQQIAAMGSFDAWIATGLNET